MAYLIKLSPLIRLVFTSLLLLKSLFNYRPIWSYIAPNNSIATVILATFGNEIIRQLPFSALGLEKQLLCTKNVTGPACENRPCECKLYFH